MADGVTLRVQGLRALAEAFAKLAPDLRNGAARKALRKAAEPVKVRATAETPILAANVYNRYGKMIRRAGTLRRAVKIRSSKDARRNGDVGVFVNYKPLGRKLIQAFKEATGRRGSDNPDDPFYWRWVHFATRRNKNPKPALTIAGNAALQSQSLPILEAELKRHFDRLNGATGT